VLVQIHNSESEAATVHKHDHIPKVGQNHVYTVYARYFWQEDYQAHSHTVNIDNYGQPYTYAQSTKEIMCKGLLLCLLQGS